MVTARMGNDAFLWIWMRASSARLGSGGDRVLNGIDLPPAVRPIRPEEAYGGCCEPTSASMNGARELHEWALAGRQVLGDDHPHTPTSMNSPA
jgi:hypothetical protein